MGDRFTDAEVGTSVGWQCIVSVSRLAYWCYELVVLQESDVGVDCTCVVYLVGWWGYGSLDTHSCVVWAMLVCSMYHNVSW